MISFLKNLEFKKLKTKSCKLNRGMTYVELIVVLSIFGTMTSVVLFNYGDFQAKVDIKVLANDIALKIVEAQKSAINGKLPVRNLSLTLNWKPSYGVHFDSSLTLDPSDNIYFNKKFIYFTDLDTSDKIYNPSNCPGLNDITSTDECLDKITITKNNSIFSIESYVGATSTPIIDPLSIIFTRPNSDAVFYNSAGDKLSDLSSFDYIKITLSSSGSIKGYIKIYPSGRIQVN